MELIRVKSLTNNHCGATPKPVDYWKLSAVKTLWYAWTWERELTSRETRRKNTTGGKLSVGTGFRRSVKWKVKTQNPNLSERGRHFTWITSRPFCTQVLHFLLYFPLTPSTVYYLLVWTKISQNWFFFFNKVIKLIEIF